LHLLKRICRFYGLFGMEVHQSAAAMHGRVKRLFVARRQQKKADLAVGL